MELSFIRVTVRHRKLSETVLQTIFPEPCVNGPIGVDLPALPVLLIIEPIAFVNGTIKKDEGAVPMALDNSTD